MHYSNPFLEQSSKQCLVATTAVPAAKCVGERVKLQYLIVKFN